MLRANHDIVAAADLLALLGTDGVLLDNLLDQRLGRACRGRVRPSEGCPRERGDEDEHGSGLSSRKVTAGVRQEAVPPWVLQAAGWRRDARGTGTRDLKTMGAELGWLLRGVQFVVVVVGPGRPGRPLSSRVRLGCRAVGRTKSGRAAVLSTSSTSLLLVLRSLLRWQTAPGVGGIGASSQVPRAPEREDPGKK
jgi:hypothetical protein